MNKNRVLYRDAQAADRDRKYGHRDKTNVISVSASAVKPGNEVSFYSRSGAFVQGVVEGAQRVKSGIRITFINGGGGYSIIDADARVAVVSRSRVW